MITRSIAGGVTSALGHPEVCGGISVLGDASRLVATGMTFGDGIKGDTAIKVLGTAASVGGWVFKGLVIAHGAAACTGLSIGLGAGSLIDYGYQAATGSTIGDDWAWKMDRVDGTLMVVIPSFVSGVSKAGVACPVENGSNVFGSVPIIGQGIGGMIIELKGTTPNQL